MKFDFFRQIKASNNLALKYYLLSLNNLCIIQFVRSVQFSSDQFVVRCSNRLDSHECAVKSRP